MSKYDVEISRLIDVIPAEGGELCSDCRVDRETFEEVACWDTTAQDLADGYTMADPARDEWRWADRDIRRAATCLLRRAGNICSNATKEGQHV